MQCQSQWRKLRQTENEGEKNENRASKKSAREMSRDKKLLFFYLENSALLRDFKI